MPAGTPFAMPDHYQLVANYLGADPTEKWRSEFTIAGVVGTVPLPGDPIVTDIETYFVENLRTDCILESLELRNWSYGPQPIAARGSIWIKPLSLPGTKTVPYGGEQAAPALTGKEVVAFIKLLTTSGRPGKQFLRQLLDLGDVGAVAGSPWKFLTGARVTPTSYHSVVTSNLSAHIGAGASTPNLVVTHFSKKAYDANPIPANHPFFTNVVDMQLINPSTNRPTRKNKK